MSVPKIGDPGYLDQHCALCFEKPVRYVKTKGSFHKLCHRCELMLRLNGLLVKPDAIHATGTDAGGEK